MSQFPTTRWSLIHNGDRTQAQIVASWRELVHAYQPAILQYFRRRAASQDAQNLAQEFLLRSIDDQWWARADPKAGSFRQFLLMLMKRFLATQMDTGYRRFERTGEVRQIGEADQIGEVSADQLTPDRYFDLQFMLRLTGMALEELRQDYVSCGRGATFDALSPWLVEAPAHGELALLGKQLELAPNTLSVQLKRLRTRLHKAV